MKILIDGYNVVHYIARSSVTAQQVTQFLAQLRRYARFTEHQIIVIFDGGESDRRYQGHYHGLTVWYSGSRETADDLIKEFLPRYNPDELVLISDDRQLNEVAQTLDIVSVSPAFFVTRIAEKEGAPKLTKKEQHGIHKISEDTNEEVDRLMHMASNHIQSKNETMSASDGIVKGKKRSKLERRLDALMRKL